ncbi:hypothetical protein [Bradyrhizobium zhanjiangense]|uniref:hypothetical protein n=1 Tax=Bradyrhizobium zhanjiangense TaxID=1325107 RepID=UPI001FDF37A7|nr:hypothetical protein [Bradyrhizobium zhanjiangense]
MLAEGQPAAGVDRARVRRHVFGLDDRQTSFPPRAEPVTDKGKPEKCASGARKPATEWLSRRAAVAGLAVLPAGLAGVAGTEPDPIFDVIARNREFSAQHDAAVSISAKLAEGPEFDAADEISGERQLALAEHANTLIHSKPTTIAGVIALSRLLPAYLRGSCLMNTIGIKSF